MGSRTPQNTMLRFMGNHTHQKPSLALHLGLVLQILVGEKRHIGVLNTQILQCFTKGYPRSHLNNHRLEVFSLDPLEIRKAMPLIHAIVKLQKSLILDMSPFRKPCISNWYPSTQQLMWRRSFRLLEEGLMLLSMSLTI